MSLTKVNYIDNSTIITAKNLNDIQDNIIELDNNLNDIQDNIIELNNSTIITAKNLNDIQNNIIELNNNSISKDNIINNFTTTEEGFVADARALKTLNDTKMSMKLLWKNSSPTSSFAGNQTLNLDIDVGDIVIILYTRKAESTYFVRSVISEVRANQYYVELFNAWSSIFTTRNAIISPGKIYFKAGKSSAYNNTGTLPENNSYAIPLEVYVIKEVS